MPKMTDRLQHAWNAFRYGEQVRYRDYGPGFYYQPTRSIRRIGTERSIVMALYNRIAMDVANIDIKHVRLDENDRYVEDIKSGLNNCLTLEANIDQTGRAFIQDVVLSMLEEGVVAVVPVETDINPTVSGAYDITSMRTGRITQWYTEHVLVNLYNDKTGMREDVMLPKSMVAIIENPFYAIMNEPNSTLQRLIRKLNLLDDIDEQSGAGKLDLIIQLPYTIRSEARKLQAKERKKDIEMQLAGSKYGIAYIDAAEHVTQLNRSVDNNLMKQIEYLTSMLYSQLAMSEDLLKGIADEKVNLNYINNTIEPIVSAICNEYKRKFLTKWARTQRQSIKFFRDPFKLVPIDNIAEIADKFTRNEIVSSNEMRQVIGMKPSDDPKADQLVNSNMPQADLGMAQEEAELGEVDAYRNNVSSLDELDDQLDELDDMLKQDDLAGENLSHYASPYYDPVYAHEYYMQHRKLKGRSKGSLNDEGQAAAEHVKKMLQEEKTKRINESDEHKKSTISRSNESTKGVIDSNKEKMESELRQKKEQVDHEIETHKVQLQNRIDALRNQLSSLSTKQKAEIRARVSDQISKLRQRNADMRASLNSAYSEYSSTERNQYNTKSASLKEDNKQVSENAKKEHKSNVEKAKADYEKKLDEEMEKIHNTAEFQKEKKTKSSGRRSSGSGSKSSSKKKDSGRDYSGIIAAYKKKKGLIK